MFNSRGSVDRHVQELFRKVTDERERNLRCYNIAKLYYQVGDYESARRYVSSYLEVRNETSGAHKLLGQILEAQGQKEAALAQFKMSLELEARQDDLVLKVCELLADIDIGLDVNRIKYWVDRASEKFAHNPIVFQLKEKLLTVDRPNGTGGDLEALIASELSARPSDVSLRVKLLMHYLSQNRLEEAYKHAMDVESTHAHRDSLPWYESLCTILAKYKDSRTPHASFWIPYISSLERYAALALQEHSSPQKNLQEASSAVFNLDQALTIAKLQNYQTSASFIDQMFTHMFGQLNYHIACLLIRRTKREQGSWNEIGRLCSPLLLSAIHSPPIDPSSPGLVVLKEPNRSLVHIWHKEGAYRVSQSSHVLQAYSRDDAKRLLDKVDKFCSGSWRERIYQRTFTANPQVSKMSTSYFANNNSPAPPLRLPPASDIRKWDELAEQVNPASLHHHVWLGLANQPSRRSIETFHSPSQSIYPNQTCHVFPDLQLSAYNLSQAVPDSLGRLDIDAFLNATILCSSMILQEQQKSGFLHRDRLPTLPADTTNVLCTVNQQNWWTAAYRMYNRKSEIVDPMEARHELQRGLETIRCIGNHGLHINVIVHLARMFHHRAKEVQSKEKSHPDVPMLEARYELYWETAVPLLERLINNQTIRTTSSKMFDYQGHEMNNLQLSNALEEGRLILARKLVRAKQHEQAIEALQKLKCPEASFLQAEIFKTLSDELVGGLPKESLTAAIRSQHAVLLAKSRDCYYLTLDRLRAPGINPNHPLNSELGSRIASIENHIKKINPDHRNSLHMNTMNRNDEVLSEDSYSSAHSGAEPVLNSMNTMNHGLTMITPHRPTHRTPKSSTPRHQHHDYLEHTHSRIQMEARPSPERLDAQIRQLIHTKDHVSQTILEQNKNLLDSVKGLLESNKQIRGMVEDLRKEFADFRKDSHKRRSRSHQEEDYSYDDDYSDMNYTQPVGALPPPPIPPQMPGNLFAGQRHPYSPLVYPPGGLPGYYQGGLPFTDPQGHPIPPIYSPSVYQMPLYPRGPEQGLAGMQAGIQPGMQSSLPSGIQPAMFNQGLFPNRLMDIVSPQTVQGTPLIMGMQNLDLSRSETAPQTQFSGIKDAPVNKAPPSNVVITTSDTVPTTTPTVQPTLSVTIPPHHRNVGTAGTSVISTITTVVSTGSQASSAPHNYQISMPSHANIPTTVILPPLAASVTNTMAAISERNKNASILSTGSHNSSIEAVEVEHDPIPDFQPVIPLPAEIKVTTGEEDEEILFVARAKLFRFVEKEWKERGIGNVKLLKNKEGRVRLLMRRDQVLKICANHLLSPEMELSQMPNNDKAWMWVANDFADEEVRLEKLCIRFKTPDEGQEFKRCFDSSKSLAPVKPAQPAPAPATPVVLGGFSFSKAPIVNQAATPEASKPKEPEAAKPSPFAGFTFSKSTTPASNFSFGKSTEPKCAVPPPQKITELSGELIDNQVLLFSKTAVLSRSSSGQWKESGSGSVDLFLDPKTGKVRLQMKKSDSKTWCNQIISSTFTLAPAPSNSSMLIWTPDPKTGKHEQYAVSFQEPDDALRLKESVSWLQKLMSDDKIPAANVTKYDQIVKISESLSLAEMFKPAAGSWECGSCYTRNVASSRNCVACNALGKVDPSVSNVSSISNFSNVSSAPNITNASSTPKVSNASTTNKNAVPLSELFKPAADSWECKSCYTRNTKANQYCVACDGPKEPGMPPKPQIGGFGLGQTGATSFSFGVPASAKKESSLTFSFGIPSVKETGGKDLPAPATQGTDFSFGNNQEMQPKSFSFGSPGKSFDFQFSSKSPGKSPGKPPLDVSEDEVPESEDVYFAPVVPLPDKIEVKTGEEGEEILYVHRAKLFRFDGNTKEWKERGLGDIKLLRHKETMKLRLVMRREQTLKLCLNHMVSEETELKPRDEKTWMWNAADYSDNEIDYVQLACRFKTPEIAGDFKAAVEGAIAGAQKGEAQVPGESPKPLAPPKSLTPGSVQDIQVVYEVKVTDEEKAAALKLKLPENFYAYKQKEDCPGCLGCQEPDVPLFAGTESPKGKSPEMIKLAPSKITPPSAKFEVSSPPPQRTVGLGEKGEEKTSFSFGQKADAETPKSGLEDLKICSPEDKAIDFHKPLFGGPPIGGFGTSGQPSIFSGSAAPKNIFGGSGKNFSSSTSFSFGTPQGAIFGAASKETPPSFSALNDSQNESKALGDSPFGSHMSFENLVTTAPANPFGVPKSEEKTGQSDLLLKSDNSISFGAVAATGAVNTFKQDPNFTFAGAGQSVFGARTLNSVAATGNSSISTSADTKKSQEEETEGTDDQEHDPHFEPIVPLPDAIEVRTGEEEETKTFGHRAKLYRYEVGTKEWKERGTGEMKLLHHEARGTYRLLLRREQVHKVVCNFLVTPDLELKPLNTSDRAWIWAGMNFAEETGQVEELAVKFKNSELAGQFREAVERAQEDLVNRSQHVVGEDEEEEDDLHSLMYEAEATLMVAEDSDEWKVVGGGQIKMVYDSNIYGEKITFETPSGQLMCSTVISIETEIFVEGDTCTWTAIDDAFDPPTRRSFKVKLASADDAQDFLMNFKEGQVCARQACISEAAYYAESEENYDNDREEE